ncbi:MAG: hypothetical protein IEMM0002_1576 [bacterium]|nr:MAG: hypothetical protein IEMM0002_1576 [bacterium]
MLRNWGMEANHLALLDGYVTAAIRPTLNSAGLIGGSAGIGSNPGSNSGTVVANLPDNTGMIAGSGEMLQIVRGTHTPPSGTSFLWDTRSSNEYNGVSGSTPGAPVPVFEGTLRDPESGGPAAWIEWTNTGLVNSTVGRFNSTATLQSTLNSRGIVSTDTIYTWCRTSYRAMVGMIVGHISLGYPLKVYDEAWMGWGFLSDNSGDLPAGSLFLADRTAETANGPTFNSGPGNPGGAISVQTSPSGIIINDKAYKGIPWTDAGTF